MFLSTLLLYLEFIQNTTPIHDKRKVIMVLYNMYIEYWGMFEGVGDKR